MNVKWFTLVAFASALVVPAAEDALPSGARSAQGATVVVNEVQYDPPPSGREGAYEWVELLNTGPAAVSLAGWRIADNRSSDEIPALDIEPGAFVVLAGGDGFADLFPEFKGRVVTLGGSVGNGLGNSGDKVLLLQPDGTVVDGMSYGDNADVLDPPAPRVEAGHSLERVPAGVDTDSAGDWFDQSMPSPGESVADVHPTDTPTTEPPPTVPPGTSVVLNEYLPAPDVVDWDGDGEATPDDEWVELFNVGEVELSLRGWQLDDLPDGGSDPYVIPDGTVIAPRGHLLIFKHESGVALNNSGDDVRLIRPDGTVADATSYRRAVPDASYSRDGDGFGPWSDALPPSPGSPNTRSSDPPTTRPVPTMSTPASPPGSTPTPPTGPTSGPGPGDSPVLLPYLVSEILFDPFRPGNDAEHEWVELHNRSNQSTSLAGWSVGDRAAWDALPDVVVPPRGFVVVVASRAVSTTLDTHGAAKVVVDDGRIGNGLANRGDVVRLRGPTGVEADAVSYGVNLDAFDPAVPIGAPGSSIERIPPDQDTDNADDWWPQPAPSPGRAGERREGPPRVVINEVLPAPSRVDWDGDGVAGNSDEWVELYNAEDYAADLTGWRLARGEADGWSYRLPRGTIVPLHGFRVIYRAESDIALANSGDEVVLVRNDGVAADATSWQRSPGYDRSLSRTIDGSGVWTDAYAVTPGGPNRPASPPPRAADEDGAPTHDPARSTLLSDVRGLRVGTRVQVRGQITAPPGVFGERTAYLGDQTGGVKVFLKPKDKRLPELAAGTHVVATGRLRDYHGEREIVVDRPVDLWSAGPGVTLPPIDIATGALGEALEGRLVRMSGRVTGWRGAALTLDDGSGEARVVVRREGGFRRPWVVRDQWLSVIGLAGQHARGSPWEGGYRLTPRYLTDFVIDYGAGVTVPERLPRTGRACP